MTDLTNRLIATLSSKATRSLTTGSRVVSINRQYSGPVDTDLVTSAAYTNRSGGVNIDLAYFADEYGVVRGFDTVYGMLINVTSGTLTAYPSSGGGTSDQFTGQFVKLDGDSWGPGTYGGSFTTSSGTVAVANRNLEFYATDCTFEVVVWGTAGTPIAPVYDTDAQTWITAVEAADGLALEIGVKDAVDNLVKGLKSDGNWADMRHIALLAGPRTKDGAVILLKDTGSVGVTTNNLASMDYVRGTGLKGTASGQVVYANEAFSGWWTNLDGHITLHRTEQHTTGTYLCGGGAGNTVGFTSTASGGTTIKAHGASVSGGTLGTETSAGFLGLTRTGSSAFDGRINGTTSAAISDTSALPGSATNWNYVGGAGVSTYFSDSRVAFASVGTALTDMAAVDSRVATYLSDLAYAGV